MKEALIAFSIALAVFLSGAATAYFLGSIAGQLVMMTGLILIIFCSEPLSAQLCREARKRG